VPGPSPRWSGSGRLRSRARESWPWRWWRNRQLHERYERRREYYYAAAAARGLIYDECLVSAGARERLSTRGYQPVPRQLGEIHTVAFVPTIGWHPALCPDLKVLGPVSQFDYVALGITAEQLYNGDTAARKRLNDAFLEFVRHAHRTRPVDWIFVYASGMEMLASSLHRLREEVGVPMVNMCLDDKQSWEGPVFDGQRNGQIDIASQFDISWTSATVACEWYLVEGANPLYMPEGFDASSYHPLDLEQDIDVSFIGARYGFRSDIVKNLRRYGIDVLPVGPGWGQSAFGAEQVRIINRSRINLGLGGIGYSERLTNVKTRDFEIPGTGGGVYITSFNPDLARHFNIGTEIICYRSREEMVELIRYFLRHRAEARTVALQGRRRCMAEHRWLHRYTAVCRHLGILTD
jgi:hypothetical protein